MNFEALGLSGIWQPSLSGESKHLLVILHGRGDSAEGFEDFQQELQLPDLNILLLNAPDPSYTGWSWYGLPPDQLPGILRSRRMLETAFREIFKQGYLPENCFLFGFSQGCLMTLEFGARFPFRLAGYVGVSGYVYDAETLVDEASPIATQGDWLITHGTVDEVLPVEVTRAQIQTLNRAGFALDYREYPKSHTIDPVVEFPLIREWLRARM